MLLQTILAVMGRRQVSAVAGNVPLADVESSRIDLAGRFAELLDRLEAAVARLVLAKRRPSA